MRMEMKRGIGIRRGGSASGLVAVFVLAVVASAVSGAGVVLSAGSPDPPPPEQTMITLTVNRTCITPGEAALITARATNKSGVPEVEWEYVLVFTMSGPSDAKLINSSTGGSYVENKVVWDRTDEDGYAHAILKAGTVEGTVSINVFYLSVTTSTEVVIAEECTYPELVVTAIEPNRACGGEFLFANESNVIDATIRNIGMEDAGPFNVSFSTGGGGGIPKEIRVPGLAANSSIDVNVSDQEWRLAGDNVTIRVVVDSEDEVEEISESNNVKESDNGGSE